MADDRVVERGLSQSADENGLPDRPLGWVKMRPLKKYRLEVVALDRSPKLLALRPYVVVTKSAAEGVSSVVLTCMALIVGVLLISSGFGYSLFERRAARASGKR
jgi:hypothetical protein